jgi:hypothetical protein
MLKSRRIAVEFRCPSANAMSSRPASQRAAPRPTLDAPDLADELQDEDSQQTRAYEPARRRHRSAAQRKPYARPAANGAQARRCDPRRARRPPSSRRAVLTRAAAEACFPRSPARSDRTSSRRSRGSSARSRARRTAGRPRCSCPAQTIGRVRNASRAATVSPSLTRPTACRHGRGRGVAAVSHPLEPVGARGERGGRSRGRAEARGAGNGIEARARRELTRGSRSRRRAPRGRGRSAAGGPPTERHARAGPQLRLRRPVLFSRRRVGRLARGARAGRPLLSEGIVDAAERPRGRGSLRSQGETALHGRASLTLRTVALLQTGARAPKRGLSDFMPATASRDNESRDGAEPATERAAKRGRPGPQLAPSVVPISSVAASPRCVVFRRVSRSLLTLSSARLVLRPGRSSRPSTACLRRS